VSGGHAEISVVLLALVVILVAAKLGGDLASRIGQPAVLGELVAGVLIGNLGLAGFHGLEFLRRDPSVDLLAQLGVVVLLFEVGLESTVRDMMRVGLSSLLVACLGVVTPFALGWIVGAVFLPGHSAYMHAFLGATLTATSVGITARVLKDLGRSHTPEAKIILGAAVIDDVLGLMILAIVGGVIAAADRGASLSAVSVAVILAKSSLFLFGALALGPRVSPRLFQIASRLRASGILLAVSLAFCFALSYVASVIGLAPIVGAFAAGLILERVHYAELTTRGEHQLEEQIRPIAAFLVPVFFVLMGLHVELATFAQPRILGLAGAITLVAVLGKQACSLGALGRGLDRLSIGIGMIPRGEVGLIFASIGATLTVAGERIVDPGTYSAIVIMVIVTTMATPPALKWSLTRGAAAR
jgi:Kef-type K+ transport system membrane component KefB